MSNFKCKICGTSIINMPTKGQITFCKHHPPEDETVDKLKAMFGIKD